MATRMPSNFLKLLICMWFTVGCSPDHPSTDETKADTGVPLVYAVNYPLAYFAERIGGRTVKVQFPAPPDVDPAYWTPGAEVVSAYQQADLILLNGAGYAGWTRRATFSPSRLVDTSAAVDRLIPVGEGITHTHGPEGDHNHKGTAFTTWLDLQIAAVQARAVFQALARLRPDNEFLYREHLQQLEAELGALDERLDAVAERIGDRPLVFSHPVYQYLRQGYGLNGRAVHWEPDEIPAEDQWRELNELLATHAAAWMIWEDQPLPDIVMRLRELGIQSLVFRPSANRPSEQSFMRVMLDNVVVLEQAFPASSA